MKYLKISTFILLPAILLISCLMDPVDDQAQANREDSGLTGSDPSSSSTVIDCSNYGMYQGPCAVCRPDTISNLLANQVNWEALNISNYFISIEYAYKGMIGMEYYTLNLGVENSTCVTNWYPNGDLSAADLGKDPVADLFTSALLFVNATHLELTNDQNYYFPIHIFGDYTTCAWDEERLYRVISFTNYGNNALPF